MDVVGPRPRRADWLTPQAQAVLAAADDMVGYGPYVDRVPPNPRQRRHASDNRVEAERAEFALDLALRGRRVAVVSSGDPGVFAMATAVLEVAAERERSPASPVDVVPGLTAAQAVASLAGAPLGHDYVMLSLSDRLKPWEVVAQRLPPRPGRLRAGDLQSGLRSRTAAAGRHARPAARTPVPRTRPSYRPGRRAREQRSGVQLADLDPAEIDMRCLLIVGSSPHPAHPTVVDGPCLHSCAVTRR